MYVYWSNYPIFSGNVPYYSVGMGNSLLATLCEINNKSYTRVYNPYFYIVNKPDKSCGGFIKKRKVTRYLVKKSENKISSFSQYKEGFYKLNDGTPKENYNNIDLKQKDVYERIFSNKPKNYEIYDNSFMFDESNKFKKELIINEMLSNTKKNKFHAYNNQHEVYDNLPSSYKKHYPELLEPYLNEPHLYKIKHHYNNINELDTSNDQDPVNLDPGNQEQILFDVINTYITIQPHHNDIKYYRNKINILPIKEDVLDFLSCGLSLDPIFDNTTDTKKIYSFLDQMMLFVKKRRKFLEDNKIDYYEFNLDRDDYKDVFKLKYDLPKIDGKNSGHPYVSYCLTDQTKKTIHENHIRTCKEYLKSQN